MKLKAIMYALGYGKSRKQLVRAEGARRVKQAERMASERSLLNVSEYLYKYGSTARKLSKTLGVTKTEVDALLSAYRGNFPLPTFNAPCGETL